MPEQTRVHFLDEVRGFAVFCMVFYHAFYFFGYLSSSSVCVWLYDFFTPLEPLFAGLFIFICGISCSLSHSNVKRGLRLLGISAAFTLVTAVILPRIGFAECEIWFGILHFLSCAILLFALLHPALDRIPVFAGLLVCAVLYPFFAGIPDGALRYGELLSFRLPEFLYRTNWLVPLGFYNTEFYSADYFPIFPDIFIFLAGTFAGRYFAANGFPEWSYPRRVPFFGFLGRHALIIYIAHMPLVAGLATLIGLV